MSDQTPASVALDLGPRPLNPPIVSGLEERPDLVLLLEPELGGVDPRKRQRSLVAGLEEDVRRVQIGRAQVQVRSALRARVDRRRSHFGLAILRFRVWLLAFNGISKTRLVTWRGRVWILEKAGRLLFIHSFLGPKSLIGLIL